MRGKRTNREERKNGAAAAYDKRGKGYRREQKNKKKGVLGALSKPPQGPERGIRKAKMK